MRIQGWQMTGVAKALLLFAFLSFFIVSVVAGPLPSGNDHWRHRTWFVSATAPSGGDGSADAPFNTLAAVQQASQPGDTIIIEPAPLDIPPLDGGIALKPGQRLIGGGPPVLQIGQPLIQGGPPVVGPSGLDSLPQITNSTNATNSGDAVTLAVNTEVRNLVIAGAYRGGIYGLDVVDVEIRDNDVSGFNTSGINGFQVLPFCLEGYAPFVNSRGADCPVPSSAGIKAGWAAILIDTDSGASRAKISRNYVHDGVCGDGIDLRAMGTGYVDAKVDGNFLTRLHQCSGTGIGTIEGIGTQANINGALRATLTDNTEYYNGSPGANMDSLFVNLGGSGKLYEVIRNNYYAHGIGGASTNGMEYIIGDGDNASSYLEIDDSVFEDNPGDMLELFNRGAGSRARLVLNNVVVNGTTISNGLPTYALPPGTASTPDNTGECLGIGSVGGLSTTGVGAHTSLVMRNSTFTGCDNNGIEVTNNWVTGGGPGAPPGPKTVSLDIDHSTISGSRYYNLWINDVTPLTTLLVKIEHSDLATSTSGVAVAFDMQPPDGDTTNVTIDLGGGTLGSHGRNCIYGGAIFDIQDTAYNVSAQHNWFGSASGPVAGKVSESSPGLIDTADWLTHAPAACR